MTVAVVEEDTAVGIPYVGPKPPAAGFYVAETPYKAGAVPPYAILGDPKGIPIQQTFYRDTPAPFNCFYCGNEALTKVRSKVSLAAVIACMTPLCCGLCFLWPSMDCLWHKYHYCPNCGQKVADYEKLDPCLVMDPPHWRQTSFALPS